LIYLVAVNEQTLRVRFFFPHQECFRKKKCIYVNIGEEFNIYAMSFGRDGENNFCIPCKNAKDGSNQDRISKSEILLLSLKKKHPETVGH
jgi:hypothetical protein